MLRLACGLVLVLGSACTELDSDPSRDAATTDTSRTDAPLLDGPAPVDAPALDAPTLDAPTLDAPTLDAPAPRDSATPDTSRPDAGPGCGDGVRVPGELCFIPAAGIPVTAAPHQIAVADTDGDGDDDIAVTAETAEAAFLRNDPPGTFTSTALTARPGTFDPVLADFDGDRLVDLLTVDAGFTSLYFYRGDDRRLDPAPATIALTGSALTSGRWRGDDTIYAFLARAGGGLGIHTIPAGTIIVDVLGACTSTPFDVASADMNGDGRQDAIILCSRNDVSVILSGAIPTPLTPVTTLAFGVIALAVADVDADAFEDAIVVDRAGNQLIVLPGDGTGALGVPRTTAACAGMTAITAADFDGDSISDIAVTCAFGEIALFRGTPGALLAGPRIALVGAFTFTDILAFRLDPDSDPDLLIAGPDTGALYILENVP